ncbi:MAG: nitrophenyl compound nitroreductase subunit ArsF family protein [Acidobacteriota bacterium]
MRPIISAVMLVLATGQFLAAGPDAGTAGSPSVTLYYFHRTQRCTGCTNAEARAFEAAREAFGSEIQKGRLVLKSVAVDGTKEERQLAGEFGAFGPSLFIASSKDGKSELIQLEEMWDKIREGDSAYKAYVVENLQRRLL